MDNKIGLIVGALLGLIVGVFASPILFDSSAEDGGDSALDGSLESGSGRDSANRNSDSSGTSSHDNRRNSRSGSTNHNRGDASSKPDSRPDPARRTNSSIGLEELLEAEDSVELPRGEGVITGVVTTADGTPLAGVEIRALLSLNDGINATSMGSPNRSDIAPSFGGDGLQGLNPYLRNQLANDLKNRKNTRRVFSDKDGKYRLEGLGPVMVTFSAFREGYAVTQAGTYGAVAPGARVDFVAKALVGVEFDVLMPDGSRASHADIQLQPAGNNNGSWNGGYYGGGYTLYDNSYIGGYNYGHTTQKWNSEERVLFLGDGLYDVTARLQTREGLLGSDSLTLSVEIGKAPGVQVLKLTQRPIVRGVLHVEGSEVPPNITIKYRKLDEGDDPEEERYSNKNGTQYSSAVPGNPMRFTVQDVSEGRYAFAVGYDYTSYDVIKVVDVINGVNEVDLTLPALDRNDFIEVKVHSPEGSPLSDVSLSFSVSTPNHGKLSSSTVIRKSIGHYWVRLPVRVSEGTKLDLSGMEGVITASHSAYGSATSALTVSTASSAEINFKVPASLTIEISSFPSESSDTYYANLSSKSGEGSFDSGMMAEKRIISSRMVVVDSGYGSISQQREFKKDGKVFFTGLPPGKYQMTISKYDKNYNSMTMIDQEITLNSGENHELVTLPQMVSVRVIVPQGKKDEYVYLRLKSGQGSWLNRQLDDRGEATFDQVSPDDYIVVYFGKEMVVPITASTTVHFKEMPPDAIKVLINDDSKELYKAGFRNGDLITHIDGSDIVTHQEGYKRLREIKDKGTANFTVMRGNETLFLSCDAKALLDWNTGGGHVQQGRR